MKLSGPKVSKSHSTYIDVAKPLVEFANKHKDVSNISLGFITTTKVGVKTIKLTTESGCLLLKIRGVRAIQEIRFFTSDIDAFKIELLTKIKKNGFRIIS